MFSSVHVDKYYEIFFSATAHHKILHNSREDTFYTQSDLTGAYTMASGNFKHYINELVLTFKLGTVYPTNTNI